MEIEELFKKAEKFFGMDKQEREKSIDKKEKLRASLEEKILSMIDEIKQSSDDQQKEELKKEVDVLQKLKDKMDSAEAE